MDSAKEAALVAATIEYGTTALVVVAEADALCNFAKTVAVETVLAVRVRNVDVQPRVVAQFVTSRLNRFVDAGSRAAVIEQGIDIGIVAAAKEVEALTELGLANVQAQPDASLRATQATQGKPAKPPRKALDRRKSILPVKAKSTEG